MHSHKWTLASVLTVLFAMQSTVSNAEPRIGTAASTRPNVEAVAGANTRKLSAGSEIYANQTVRTGNLGMADLVFLDKTNLSVGPRSEVRLDKFVYDPTGSGGSLVLQATRGTFRFVTGSQAKHAYQVSTPHGTMAPTSSLSLSIGTRRYVRASSASCQSSSTRGPTTVEFLVNKPGEDCVTKLRLVEGEAEYKVAKTGKVARLTDPNRNNVACINAAGDVTYSTSAQSLLSVSATSDAPPATPGGITPISPPPFVNSPTQLPL